MATHFHKRGLSRPTLLVVAVISVLASSEASRHGHPNPPALVLVASTPVMESGGRRVPKQVGMVGGKPFLSISPCDKVILCKLRYNPLTFS